VGKQPNELPLPELHVQPFVTPPADAHVAWFWFDVAVQYELAVAVGWQLPDHAQSYCEAAPLPLVQRLELVVP
jgi:hypothetical protein